MSTRSAPAASTIRAASAMTQRIDEDLDRERMLVGSDTQIAQRALVLVVEPGAAHHLRADEPGAVAAPLAAKACTLTPAIGASTSRLRISTGPMLQDCRSTCIWEEIVAEAADEPGMITGTRPTATAPLRRASLFRGGTCAK